MVTEFNIRNRDNKLKEKKLDKAEKNTSKTFKEEKKIDKVEKNGSNNPNSPRRPRQNFICYNCDESGHTSKRCRKPRRNKDEYQQAKERHERANLKLQKVPTYGLSHSNGPDGETSQVESSNLLLDMTEENGSANRKLARAPYAPDHLFMMTEVEDIESNYHSANMISNIESVFRNFPTVRLTVCKPNRELIRIGESILAPVLRALILICLNNFRPI